MGHKILCKYGRATRNEPLLWQHWTVLKAAILHSSAVLSGTSCKEHGKRRKKALPLKSILPTETANMRTLCTKERGEQDNQAFPDTSQAEGQF